MIPEPQANSLWTAFVTKEMDIGTPHFVRRTQYRTLSRGVFCLPKGSLIVKAFFFGRQEIS